MHTAELYAGPEDGRTFTVPGPCRSELRVPDSHGVRACLAMPLEEMPTTGQIPIHVYRLTCSGRRRPCGTSTVVAAIYQYVRTERC